MNEETVQGETASLRWTSWPLVEHWWRSALALTCLFVTAAAVFHLTANVPFTVIAVVILATSLQGHFLPRTYVLDPEGVSVYVLGMKLRREWSYFRSYYADALGCMLSTFTYPSRLDPFRGVNLRYDRARRDAVLTFVAARLPRAERKTTRTPGRRETV